MEVVFQRNLVVIEIEIQDIKEKTSVKVWQDLIPKVVLIVLTIKTTIGL